MKVVIVSDETAERVLQQDHAAIEVRPLDDAEDLVVKLMPASLAVPAAGMTEQARRNADLRWRFLSRYEMLDSAGVSELSGSRSTNLRATASRWGSEGRIFGIWEHGRVLYPSFQFDGEGRPRPVVRAVLETLDPLKLSEWSTAIWWDTGHEVLEWRRPSEMVDSDPEAVLEAARMDARTIGR